MDNPFDTKIPNFGLLDFFLYLTPGTFVLLSIFLFAGLTPADLDKYPSVTVSIISILVAYFLGHAIYPISYILRACYHGKPAIASPTEGSKATQTEGTKETQTEDSEATQAEGSKETQTEHSKQSDGYESDFFNDAYLTTLMRHKDYCLSQLVRYRTLSRFVIAMIVPCILISLGTFIYLLCHLKEPECIVRWIYAIAAILLGSIASLGFWRRYGRYWKRLQRIMEKCYGCGEQQEKKKDGP
jgi:hypothetical protein